jgi:hypothetical protein
MQLKKYHRKRNPNYDKKDHPHGMHRQPNDYNQRNNKVAPPARGSFCELMMISLPR